MSSTRLSDTPRPMTAAEATEICGPQLTELLRGRAAAAGPLSEEQRHVLASLFLRIPRGASTRHVA